MALSRLQHEDVKANIRNSANRNQEILDKKAKERLVTEAEAEKKGMKTFNRSVYEFEKNLYITPDEVDEYANSVNTLVRLFSL